MFAKICVLAVIVAVALANEKPLQKRSADDKVEVQHGTLNYQTVSLPKEDKKVTLLQASPVVSYEVPVEQNYVKSAEIVPTLAHTTLLQPQHVVPQIVPVQQQVVHQIPVQQAAPRYAYYSALPQQQAYYPSYPAVIPRQAAYYYPQQYQQQYYANSVPQYVKYVR